MRSRTPVAKPAVVKAGRSEAGHDPLVSSALPHNNSRTMLSCSAAVMRRGGGFLTRRVGGKNSEGIRMHGADHGLTDSDAGAALEHRSRDPVSQLGTGPVGTGEHEN